MEKRLNVLHTAQIFIDKNPSVRENKEIIHFTEVIRVSHTLIP